MPRLALLLPAVIALHAAAVCAQSTVDYTGDYRMQGKGFGPADAAYEGTCTVHREQAAYRVSCFNSATRHTYVGKGLALGDTLSIVIGDILQGDHNASFAGEYLVVYHRRSDGVLDGTWVHAVSGAAGVETLSSIRP